MPRARRSLSKTATPPKYSSFRATPCLDSFTADRTFACRIRLPALGARRGHTWGRPQTSAGCTGAIPAPNSCDSLHRVGRANHPPLLLGQSVLRVLPCAWQPPSSRVTCTRIQMDSNPASMLGRPGALRRVSQPDGSPETQRSPTQARSAEHRLILLAVRLRA